MKVMWSKAMWLGVPREEIVEKKIYQGDMNGRFAYYRLEVELGETGEAKVDICANSRYRMWINERPVLSGPCRSDQNRQYYETVDVGSFFHMGKNVIAVQVLLCDSMYTPNCFDERAPLVSVETLPAGHRLSLEGAVKNAAGEVMADLTTGEADWRVWLDNTFYVYKEGNVDGNLGALTEKIDFTKTFADWKKEGFDASSWKEAVKLEPVGEGFEMQFGILKTFRMEERPIPLCFEEPVTLKKELGELVFGAGEYLVVEPGEEKTILFDGEVLFNAYFRYLIEGGKGAEISFTYFEKFTKGVDEVKRDDYINGQIGENGRTDRICLAGGSLLYEPFWYHTMRFLKIVIRADGEPVTFHRPMLLKTGYPLNPGTKVSSSAAWVGEIYDMCVRTLQDCMMETYMDCPFWEQMQYPMDTRLQALFTYVCSTDTKLARKALQDFHDSMLPMGLIQGRAPSNPKQVISTFSLYYIFMILEYYQRTGDLSVLKAYRADVDSILEYYDGKIGDSGLVEKLGYWDFIDWQENWQDTAGRPAAVKEGPSTIINLMYGLALQKGAEIAGITGRKGLAEEYLGRQAKIVQRVQELCWDEERGLYREGPSYQEFSQHAQSWAVLNGMVKGEKARKLMTKTFIEPDVLRCYFSTCYELFRACELSDCYELTKDQMDWWIRLLDEHCTTCPETPANSRSECHAWSALPMYEFVSVIAGIRRENGNPAHVRVTPHMDYLPDLTGEVTTEYGPITFTYKKEGNQCTYELALPEGMKGTFIIAGEERKLEAGSNKFVLR